MSRTASPPGLTGLPGGARAGSRAWGALALSLAVVGLVLALPPAAAQAEERVFGDVVVGPGETVDDVSTVAGDVTVRGVVQGDVHSGSGDIRVENGVGGDVNAGWGDVEVRAPVGGSVEAGFGDVIVDAPVGGDVEVGRGDVRLTPQARVGGDLEHGSGEVERESGAVVRGEQLAGMSAWEGDERDERGGGDGWGFAGLVGWFFATLGFAAVGVLFAVIAPGPLLAATRRAEASPGWSLVVGLFSVPAVLLLAVALAVSIIGIPLLLLLAPAYLALLLFGALVGAYLIGRRVVLATGRYRAGHVLAVFVGAAVVGAAFLVPFVGGLLVWGLALFGTGAALLALLARRRPPAYGPPPSYEEYVSGRRSG